MRRILIATSNPGKLRDFAAAAEPFGIEVAAVPNLLSLPPPPEDAPTFEANACKKAEYYSRFATGRHVLADDSGLVVEALQGAPGVRSARYAADAGRQTREAGSPSPVCPSDRALIDAANNQRLLAEMRDVPDEHRGARFVCAIAVARGGRLVICFRGEVRGVILHQLRGSGGFGYDPLFYVPEARCAFAELSPEQKANFSHRGQAFRKFLKWYASLSEQEQPQANPAPMTVRSGLKL